MTVILILGFIGALLLGASVLIGAESAIHEIEAFLLFLIASVLFTGACILDSIMGVKKQLQKEDEGGDTEIQILKLLTKIVRNTEK
jgi:hypothetical protein